MSFFEKRPLCVALAVFMTGIACWRFAPDFITISAAGLALAAFFVLLFIKKRVTGVSAVAAALTVSAVISLVYYGATVAGQTDLIGSSGEARIEMIKVNYASNYVTYADARILEFDGRERSVKVKLECDYLLDAGEGDIVRARGEFVPLEEDGYFDSDYYRSKGYYVRFISEGGAATVDHTNGGISGWFASLNKKTGARLAAILDKDASALCRAVFLGDRSDIDPGLRRDFSEIGISHMLALSGMHLSVLIAGVFSLLRKTGLHRKRLMAVMIVICVLYIMLTGAPVSVVRAGLMYILMAAATLIDREYDPVTALFVSGGLIVAFNPNSVYDVGFLMSFFATLGILAALNRVRLRDGKEKPAGKLRRVSRFVSAPVLITLSAVAFTLPFNFLFFGRISLISPVTNLIFAPLVSAVLLLTPVAAGLSFIPFLSKVIAFLLNAVCAVISDWSAGIADMGVMSVPLNYPFVKYMIAALCVTVFALMFVRFRRRGWVFVPFAAFIVAFAVGRAVFLAGFDSCNYVAFASDGKNDVICVYADGGSTIIDCTAGKRNLAQSAVDLTHDKFYTLRVDCYVFTHYHKNNAAVLSKLSGQTYVERVVMPVPVGADDKSVARAITDVCERERIDVYYYDSGGFVLGGEVTVVSVASQTPIRKHPAVRVDITAPGGKVVYLGAHDGLSSDAANGADAVLFGAHGQKVKRKICLTAKPWLASFGSEQVEKTIAIESDESVVAPDGDFTVIRIKK